MLSGCRGCGMTTDTIYPVASHWNSTTALVVFVLLCSCPYLLSLKRGPCRQGRNLSLRIVKAALRGTCGSNGRDGLRRGLEVQGRKCRQAGTAAGGPALLAPGEGAALH